MPNPIVIGLGWYTEEQWPEYLRLMEDDVDEVHAVWLKKALDLEKMMKKEGFVVVRVPVDLGEFELWCKARQRKKDGASRAEYVQRKSNQK